MRNLKFILAACFVPVIVVPNLASAKPLEPGQISGRISLAWRGHINGAQPYGPQSRPTSSARRVEHWRAQVQQGL
jgi:hypothetical protein